MVTLRVPATTANLGPGFDSFGCALSLYNTYTFSLCDHLEIQGCPPAYCNEENLTVVAFKKVLEALGEPWHGLKMSVQAEIPVSRGLGSSAAMIVAGAAGANMLYGSRLPAEALFAICTALEGHPDNVAPALFGGLTVSLMDHNRPLTVNYPIHPSLRFVALIPDFTLRTQKARSVLPDQVPRQDAVFNASRTGFLPRALELGDERLICAALQDRLHEPYRRSLITDIDFIEQTAKKAGALTFCISGAGPTCLCLTKYPGFAAGLGDQIKAPQSSWEVRELSVVPADQIQY